MFHISDEAQRAKIYSELPVEVNENTRWARFADELTSFRAIKIKVS